MPSITRLRQSSLWIIVSAGVCTFLWVLFFLMMQPSPLHALPKDDEPDETPTCPDTVELQGRLLILGLHLDNQILRTRLITVTASPVKGVRYHPNCSASLYPLPANAFTWTLVSKPPTSTATLRNVTAQKVELTPDVVGAYLVRGVACPGGCVIAGQAVEEQAFQIELVAVNSLTFMPATEPQLTPQKETPPTTIPDADFKCSYGGGATDPQWVTATHWDGPEDYELLEGTVVRSRISRKDNFLNHDSQDFLTIVRPDPIFRRLLTGANQNMEIELERGHYPEVLRAIAGDRVSAFGFWILDCGHDYPTEIHPPVGVAVHRARPIQIPEDALFEYTNPTSEFPPTISSSVGSNVYVPGIVSDLWFTRRAGEVTNNCSITGLHQPAMPVTNTEGHVIPFVGPCIREPLSLNRVFTFTIYLPANPNRSGRSTIPLFFQVKPHPLGFAEGPDPVITVQERGGVTVLAVRVDLRNFTGDRYARQIQAGWVLAAPDNWGIQRWRVRLNEINVTNDGDSRLRGDGDWRFWFATNNAFHEWTKIFDCDGCVHSRETFGGRPWQSAVEGEVATDRWLGPDVLLFPKQRIWIHSSGFEADTFVDDDTGAVNELVAQSPAAYRRTSTCSAQSDSGCAGYDLLFQILAGAPLPAPKLSKAAEAVYKGHTITPVDSGATCPGGCRPEVAAWYPFDAELRADQQPITLTATTLFRSQPNLEVNAMTDMPLQNFAELIAKRRVSDPQRIVELMGKLRAEVDQLRASERAAEIILDLRLLRPAIPDDLWQQYFGDVMLYGVYLPLVQR